MTRGKKYGKVLYMAEKKFFLVKDVIKVLGICKKTYYNWEKAGKIRKAKRDPMNNYRIYTKQDIKRLKKITGR